MSRRRLASLLVACTVELACSGSGSPSRPPADGSALAPGPHTLSVSLAVDAGAAVPVGGVSLSLPLPPGVTVATVGDGSTELTAAAVAAGGAVPGTAIVSGAFEPSSRTLTAVVAGTPDAPWSGEVLRLHVSVEAGADVSRADLTAVSLVKAIGYDPIAHRTVLLTSQVHATSTLADETP